MKSIGIHSVASAAKPHGRPLACRLAIAVLVCGLSAAHLGAQTLSPAPTPPSPPPPSEIPEAEPPRVGPGQPTTPSDTPAPQPEPGTAPGAPMPAPGLQPPATPPDPTSPPPAGYPTQPGPSPSLPGQPGIEPSPGLPGAAPPTMTLLLQPRLEDVVDVLEAMQLAVTPIDETSVMVQLGEFNTLFTLRDNGLKLYAGFSGYDDIELRHINDWNRRKRYSTAYFDSSNDPCIEHDLDFDGGVAIPALRSVVTTFGLSVRSFAEFLADPATLQRPSANAAPPTAPGSPPPSPPSPVPNPGAGFPPAPSGSNSLDDNPAPGL